MHGNERSEQQRPSEPVPVEDSCHHEVCKPKLVHDDKIRRTVDDGSNPKTLTLYSENTVIVKPLFFTLKLVNC